MPSPVLALQSFLITHVSPILPGNPDDLFGEKTARSMIAGISAGILAPDDRIVADAREFVASKTPRQEAVIAAVARHLEPVPGRPARGRWSDGGAWAKANLIQVDVPILGSCILNRSAAGVFVAAWGEAGIRVPTLRVGRVSCLCLRRKNWDPDEDWTTHVTGYSIDADLDLDGLWERDEDLPGEWPIGVKTLRSWGHVLGCDWKGRSQDDMHDQALRL